MIDNTQMARKQKNFRIDEGVSDAFDTLCDRHGLVAERAVEGLLWLATRGTPTVTELVTAIGQAAGSTPLPAIPLPVAPSVPPAAPANLQEEVEKHLAAVVPAQRGSPRRPRSKGNG